LKNLEIEIKNLLKKFILSFVFVIVLFKERKRCLTVGLFSSENESNSFFTFFMTVKEKKKPKTNEKTASELYLSQGYKL
jgi:hypothetical protein